MENLEIKEEYVEPEDIGNIVKEEPIDIKTERVNIKVEQIKSESNEPKLLLKKEIDRADSIKEEYVEYELFPSDNSKIKGYDSWVKQALVKRENFYSSDANDPDEIAAEDFSPEKNICQHCEREFNNVSILERHLTTHHSAKYHKCSFCENEFRRKWSLDIHVQDHHKDKISKCEKCDEMFTDMTDLKCHVDRKHGRKIEKEKVKNTMPHFTEMMLLPWKCKECGEEFTTEKALKTHTHVVHEGGLNPNRCKLCDFVGKDTYKLRFHMLRKHPVSETAKFKCKHCEHTTLTSSQLKIHMSHHVKFVYKCAHCSELCFTKKNDYRMHMLRHGEPYTCSMLLCNKSFPIQKSFDQHMLVHHEKDPLHSCKQCDKTFNRFSDLKKHIIKMHKQTFEDSNVGIGLKEKGS